MKSRRNKLQPLSPRPPVIDFLPWAFSFSTFQAFERYISEARKRNFVMQNIKLTKHSKPRHSSVSTGQAPGAANRCQILAKKGFLTVRDVTSGVALLLYSQEFRLGVLLQLSSSCDLGVPAAHDDVDGFAKPALALILSEFETLGVTKTELLTYAIGGSAQDGAPEASALALRRALWDYGLVLSASDLGGHQVRSIWMDVESGRTIIRSQPLAKGGAVQTGTAASLAVAS